MPPIMHEIRMDDLRRRRKKLHETLPSAKLERIPPLFGLHGTTSKAARSAASSQKLLVEGVQDKEAHVGGTDKRGFFFYLGSGRDFDFDRGWKNRVRANRVRESVSATLKEALSYADSCRESWSRSPASGIETGLGIVVLELGIEALAHIKTDEGEVQVPGASPKYLPPDKFGSVVYRIRGAVYTDDELGLALHAIASSARLYHHSMELGGDRLTKLEREILMEETPYPEVTKQAVEAAFLSRVSLILLDL